jgi:hypothetical protein
MEEEEEEERKVSERGREKTRGFPDYFFLFLLVLE